MDLPRIASSDALHSQQNPSGYWHMPSVWTFLLGFPCVKVIGTRCDGEKSKSNKTYPSSSGDLGLEHSRGSNHSGLHFGFKFICLAKSGHCNKILCRDPRWHPHFVMLVGLPRIRSQVTGDSLPSTTAIDRRFTSTTKGRESRFNPDGM